MKPKTPKPPKHIWADYNPYYPKSCRWTFYQTKADQRHFSPELKPIKLKVVEA